MSLKPISHKLFQAILNNRPPRDDPSNAFCQAANQSILLEQNSRILLNTIHYGVSTQTFLHHVKKTDYKVYEMDAILDFRDNCD